MAKQKLIPGVTKIGKVNVLYEEQKLRLDLYYGNLVLYDNKRLMIPEDEYVDIFNTFISDPNNDNYGIPDEEQFFRDIDELHSMNQEQAEEVEIEQADNNVEEQIEEDDKKANKKDLRFYKITNIILSIICVALLGCLFLSVYQYQLESEDESNEDSDTFQVITVSKDIQKGDVFSEDDLIETSILKSEYTTNKYYIDADGNQKEDKIMLFANKEALIGKYASCDIKQGEYVYTSSYSSIINDGQTVQLQLEDGTTVKIQANQIESGDSTVHLYAIISSSNDDDQVVNTAVDLGEIKFEGKALTDILNQQGVSIISQN